MEQEKNRLRIFTNHETILRDSIKWYNATYNTDFIFVEYILDEVNFAIVEFTNVNFNQVFDLGRIHGGSVEAVDKNISNPGSIFM